MGKKQNRKANRSDRPSNPKRDRDQQVQRLITYVGIAAVALIAVVVALFALDDFGSGISGEITLSTERQPTMGSENAAVEVVEFADFKCPACAVFKTDILPQLKADYIDTGQISFSFLNFPLPLGEDSWTAAIATECVYHQMGNAAFWDYYDGIFANQGPERQAWATPDLLVQLAQDYVDRPVNPEELRRCIVDEEYRNQAERDRQMGANADIPGTPSIFVNGQRLSDVRYGTIADAIDRALRRANAAD